MKTCKAKTSNGIPCINQVDEGQEYCPFHLGSQVADLRKSIKSTGIMLAFVVGAMSISKAVKPVFGFAATSLFKVAKNLVSKL